jgi:hypothetical protein
VTAAAAEPDVRPCDGDSAAVPGIAHTVVRSVGREIELEVLLPAVTGDSLVAGQVRALNVILIDRRAAEWPLAWSAPLDMQPLGNPLLWGRLVLEPPAARGAR